MQENISKIVSELKDISNQVSQYNKPTLNKDKRKKHSDAEMVINSTIAVINNHMNQIEFNLLSIQKLGMGLEQFTKGTSDE